MVSWASERHRLLGKQIQLKNKHCSDQIVPDMPVVTSQISDRCRLHCKKPSILYFCFHQVHQQGNQFLLASISSFLHKTFWLLISSPMLRQKIEFFSFFSGILIINETRLTDEHSEIADLKALLICASILRKFTRTLHANQPMHSELRL